MDDRLKNSFTKVINKHYSAVQTDERLGQTDDYKPGLEKKARQFWADYEAASEEFKALLERCVINDQ